MNFAKFLRTPFLQNSFRRLCLCFQIYVEFPNLAFEFSKSRRVFSILHCACDLILRSVTIFNSKFLKNFKTICILKFKARLKHKESYEKDLHVPYDNKFSCLQCKWYEVKKKVQTELLDLFKFDRFVFLVPSLPTLLLLILALLSYNIF